MQIRALIETSAVEYPIQETDKIFQTSIFLHETPSHKVSFLCVNECMSPAKNDAFERNADEIYIVPWETYGQDVLFFLIFGKKLLSMATHVPRESCNIYKKALGLLKSSTTHTCSLSDYIFLFNLCSKYSELCLVFTVVQFNVSTVGRSVCLYSVQGRGDNVRHSEVALPFFRAVQREQRLTKGDLRCL